MTVKTGVDFDFNLIKKKIYPIFIDFDTLHKHFNIIPNLIFL